MLWTEPRPGATRLERMHRTASVHPPQYSALGTYMPALDGLRGVAILGVLLFHTGQLPGGFLGVDLFFVLSGYLITGLLLREVAATGRVSLIAFWGRRARRLLPALATMLVVVTLVVWMLASSDLLRTTLADGPWVQAQIMNWHLLAESASYWDQFGAVRVFEHLWSIAVEEQFYVVWPVIVLLVAWAGRRAGTVIPSIAAIVSVASLAVMIVLADPADPTRVYIGTDTRAFSLLLGAVVAAEPVRDAIRRLIGRSVGIVAVVLMTGLLAAWFLVSGVETPFLFSGGLFVHSLVVAVLIALCAEAPGTRVARALAWKPLRYVGLISYSLYLWHWPVMVLLTEASPGLSGWPLAVLVGGVSVALAAIAKQFVEDPIRHRMPWLRGWPGFFVFTVAMIGLAALWLLLPGPAPIQIDVTRLN